MTLRYPNIGLRVTGSNGYRHFVFILRWRNQTYPVNLAVFAGYLVFYQWQHTSRTMEKRVSFYYIEITVFKGKFKLHVSLIMLFHFCSTIFPNKWCLCGKKRSWTTRFCISTAWSLIACVQDIAKVYFDSVANSQSFKLQKVPKLFVFYLVLTVCPWDLFHYSNS